MAFSENSDTGEFGGTILNLAGTLRVDDTTVSGSVVPNGAGGGVAILAGVAEIRQSIISANRAFPGPLGGNILGGGIYVGGGVVSIQASTIAGNTAGPGDFIIKISAFGGGLFVAGGKVSITDSAVTENQEQTIGDGGGIYNGGNMTIVNSTIGGNETGRSGGGIYNKGKLSLQGVTLAHNVIHGFINPFICLPEPPSPSDPECTSAGGGIWSDPAGTVRIATSVVAANVRSIDCHGVLMSEGHNALGNDSDCTLQPLGGATGDQVDLDPGIAADLEDNGEPGNAHYPLLTHSPLIDAGGRIGPHCTPRDQIGNRRVDGDGDNDHGQICDVGAIEFQP
jgi:hypothetical protein